MTARSTPSSRDSPAASMRTVNTTAGRGPVGQQARRRLRQRRRVQRHLAVRQVHRAAALPGLAVEHAVRVDEEPDVGDGVVQHDVVAGLLDGERLVEIGGRSPGRASRSRPTCDRRARHPGARVAASSAAATTSAGNSPGTPASARIASRPAAIAPSTTPPSAASRPLARTLTIGQRRAPMNMPLRAS